MNRTKNTDTCPHQANDDPTHIESSSDIYSDTSQQERLVAIIRQLLMVIKIVDPIQLKTATSPCSVQIKQVVQDALAGLAYETITSQKAIKSGEMAPMVNNTCMLPLSERLAKEHHMSVKHLIRNQSTTLNKACWDLK